MKTKIISCMAVAWILSLGFAGFVRADDDNELITRIGQNSAQAVLREASIYLSLKDNQAEGLPALASGDETRFYIKVWDGLYLQVTTETGENGVQGYMFSISSDEGGQDLLKPEENADEPTLREVAAGDFRTDDNFSPRPLRPGPGTPDNRGPYRIIHYPGFDVEIRVLEYKIGDAELKKKPYFKNVSCLVTVKEVGKNKKH